ncbi:hypothetical protein PIB30_100822, partial [Stylosanthes scabra]|nr:hypothetical protein [Stylosanthes scabra]
MHQNRVVSEPSTHRQSPPKVAPFTTFFPVNTYFFPVFRQSFLSLPLTPYTPKHSFLRDDSNATNGVTFRYRTCLFRQPKIHGEARASLSPTRLSNS